MLEPGSPTALMIGRWGMAASFIIGAILAGRLIRSYPYLLPNRIPGLVIHELGPGLMLARAIGAAVILTRDHSARLSSSTRLVLFTAAAAVAGAVMLAVEFAEALDGQLI